MSLRCITEWAADDYLKDEWCVVVLLLTEFHMRPRRTTHKAIQRYLDGAVRCRWPVAYVFNALVHAERDVYGKSVCLSVCPSHFGIVSKRMHIPSNSFHMA